MENNPCHRVTTQLQFIIIIIIIINGRISRNLLPIVWWILESVLFWTYCIYDYSKHSVDELS